MPSLRNSELLFSGLDIVLGSYLNCKGLVLQAWPSMISMIHVIAWDFINIPPHAVWSSCQSCMANDRPSMFQVQNGDDLVVYISIWSHYFVNLS